MKLTCHATVLLAIIGFTVHIGRGVLAGEASAAAAVERAQTTPEPEDLRPAVPLPPFLEDQEDAGEGPEGSADFLGNDLAHAVASYKLDGTGVLYEEHSPGTEIPRLQPKKG